jgi:Lrp/AsnC family leucine-responsive transcriptional regulator
MDSIDRQIIGALQEDGRMSATDLSDHIQLSLSATSERIRRLQASGVIAGFTIVVDPAAAGRTIEALIDLRVPAEAETDTVEAVIAELPAVIDAMHLTGPFDLQLRVAAADVAELDSMLATLKDQLGTVETNTRLILRNLDGFPRPIGV